jgi:hypothetical protein
MTTLAGLTADRAEALFCFTLHQPRPDSGDAVRHAIHDAIAFWTVEGCAALVAQEFGDHPDTAVARMGWCRTAVEAAFTPTLTGASR